MNNIQEIIKLLNLAQNSAGQDLNVSNEILSVVDKLVMYAERNQLNTDNIAEISKTLVECALELSNKSKNITASINKVVGLM